MPYPYWSINKIRLQTAISHASFSSFTAYGPGGWYNSQINLTPVATGWPQHVENGRYSENISGYYAQKKYGKIVHMPRWSQLTTFYLYRVTESPRNLSYGQQDKSNQNFPKSDFLALCCHIFSNFKKKTNFRNVTWHWKSSHQNAPEIQSRTLENKKGTNSMCRDLSSRNLISAQMPTEGETNKLFH